MHIYSIGCLLYSSDRTEPDPEALHLQTEVVPGPVQVATRLQLVCLQRRQRSVHQGDT